MEDGQKMALFVENSRKSHVYVNIDISFGLSRSRETPGGAGVPPAKIQRMAGELFTKGASHGTSRAGRPCPQGNSPYLTLFAHTRFQGGASELFATSLESNSGTDANARQGRAPARSPFPPSEFCWAIPVPPSLTFHAIGNLYLISSDQS